MFQLDDQSKIIFYPKPVNFHKGLDSLAFLVTTDLGLELMPNLFILFANFRKNRIKILYHNGCNLLLLSTRFDHALHFTFQEGVIFNKISLSNLLNSSNPRRRKNMFKHL